MADISKLNLDSTNPSSPVYNIKDELARFERISYAQWQQMTPEQQAAKPYYIYDYPSERVIDAENVGYDNAESGLAATQVQDAVDELNGGLTNIQTQSGEVASGIINGAGTADIQLPSGVGAYLLCTFRDNNIFATLYYLTYKVGGKITCTPIVNSSYITVTGELSDYHITITNDSDYPCCYAIKNLAHGY